MAPNYEKKAAKTKDFTKTEVLNYGSKSVDLETTTPEPIDSIRSRDKKRIDYLMSEYTHSRYWTSDHMKLHFI